MEKVLEETKLEVYDLEFMPKKNLLRIYIQDPNSQTASLEDCVAFDKLLGPLLEENEKTPDDLILEVSSPGVFRSLKNQSHYESALGKRVKVKTREKKVIGVLESVSESFDWIEIFLESGDRIRIRPEKIKKGLIRSFV